MLNSFSYLSFIGKGIFFSRKKLRLLMKSNVQFLLFMKDQNKAMRKDLTGM